MKRKQIILWGGWYGSKNVGDQALLLAITDLLGHTYPDAIFTVLTDNPDHVHQYASRDSIFDIRAINTRKEFSKVIRAFRKSDLFIFGGAVPFFDYTPQVVTILILWLMTRFFRVPYFLWSVSSQEINSNFTKKIFGWVLEYAVGVTCRDEFTRQLFLSCGLPSERIAITGDSVFLMRTDPADTVIDLLHRAGWQPGDRPLAALTPRTLRIPDGESETHYTLKTIDQFEKEIDVYAAVLDYLWEQGYQPLFIPMNTVEPDDDRYASRMIMAKARNGKSALMIDEEIYPRAASALYQHCHMSLVSRVHGSILSLKANCPVVMYAFDQKHVGIMQEMGLADYIFYPGKQGAEDAVDMIADILKNENDTRLMLSRSLNEAVEKSMIPVRQAVEILGK